MHRKVGAFLLSLVFSSIFSPGQSRGQLPTPQEGRNQVPRQQEARRQLPTQQQGRNQLPAPQEDRRQPPKQQLDRYLSLMKQGNDYREMQLNDFGRRLADSAIFFYRQAYDLATSLRSPQLQARSLLSIAYAQMLGDRTDSGRIYYHRVIAQFQRLGDTLDEATAWSALGTGLPDIDSLTRIEKIDAFRRAERLHRQLGKITDALKQIEALAYIYMREGKLDSAESLLQSNLREYAAIHYTKLYRTYDLLTGVYKTKGDWPHQLYYGLEMVRNAEENAPEADVSYYYYIIGGFYSDAGMHPEALYYQRKSAEYAAAHNNYRVFYDRLKTLTDELLAEGKAEEALEYCKKSIAAAPPPGNDAKLYYNMSLGDCYLALGQTDSAQYHYLVSLDCELKEQTHYNSSIFTYAFLYARLGKLYFARHQYGLARSYLNKLDSVPPHVIKPAQLRSNELLRFRVDSAMGSYVSAIRHYQVYKNIEDSLLNVNKSRQIVEMQAKYESRQKEQEIRLLQTQRNFIIGGVGLLLVIVGLLYSAYRAKHRHNLEKDRLLMEKDWLLKEIHHRVKNNLQIITSLLKTQSHFLEEGSARYAIRDTLNRVQSMSLIHHKLYTESNISTIDLPAYIGDLIFHLKNSFNDLSKHVSFQHKAEAIRMDAGQMIPIGLILNEAITNSIKYAFPKQGGTICISLLSLGPDCLELTISDNGIGLPEDFDARTTRSLGMQMIRMLTKQLDGKYFISGSPGVTIVVRFPKKYQHHE